MYNEVYQLKRAPAVEPCDTEMAKNICEEILDSVKECLCCRWDHTQLMEEPGWKIHPAPLGWTLVQNPAKDHATYDPFRHIKEGSCEAGTCCGLRCPQAGIGGWPSSKTKRGIELLHQPRSLVIGELRQSRSQRWVKKS